jgi:hypothetical protein
MEQGADTHRMRSWFPLKTGPEPIGSTNLLPNERRMQMGMITLRANCPWSKQ